jgi:hypothetical protein
MNDSPKGEGDPDAGRDDDVDDTLTDGVAEADLPGVQDSGKPSAPARL